MAFIFELCLTNDAVLITVFNTWIFPRKENEQISAIYTNTTTIYCRDMRVWASLSAWQLSCVTITQATPLSTSSCSTAAHATSSQAAVGSSNSSIVCGMEPGVAVVAGVRPPDSSTPQAMIARCRWPPDREAHGCDSLPAGSNRRSSSILHSSSTSITVT